MADARTGDGRPLDVAFRARLRREWEHLRSIETRLQTLSTERAAHIADGHDRVAVIARRLCTVRGVAEVSAAVFSAELFGTREVQESPAARGVDGPGADALPERPTGQRPRHQ